MTRGILAGLLLAVVCASSQQPSPAPGKTVQEVKDKRPDAGTKGDIAEPTASPIGKQDRSKRTDESDQPSTDNRIVWLTGALVLVGALQVFVYWRQAGYMRDGLAETRKAADAAVAAANAAQRGLILANRPKVAITGITFDVPNGTQRGAEILELLNRPVRGQIHVINQGNTPGRIIRLHSAVRVADVIHEKVPLSECDIQALDQLLSPGVRQSFPFPTNSHGPLSQDNVTRIGNGYTRLWVHGWIEYLDDIGNSRITSFCRIWSTKAHRLIAVDDPDYESAD